MEKFNRYLAMLAEVATSAEAFAKDTGVNGRAFEMSIREYFSGRPVKGVKAQGKRDAYFTFKTEGGRKKRTVEIKTACGIIDTIETAQYIVYCPEVDIFTPAELQGYVFSREQWVTFVNGYTGRGQFTRVNSRGEKHIQSFRSATRPKASKPIADYIWNSCFDMPTVAEWVAMLRG